MFSKKIDYDYDYSSKKWYNRLIDYVTDYDVCLGFALNFQKKKNQKNEGKDSSKSWQCSDNNKKATINTNLNFNKRSDSDKDNWKEATIKNKWKTR